MNASGKFATTRTPLRLDAQGRPLVAPPADASTERITWIHRWTDNLLSFRTTRDPAFSFQPGHWVRLGLASGKGGIIWRSFSMASASHADHLEFFAVIVPDGAFTTRLATAAPGDTIFIHKQPSGSLTASRFVGGRDLWMFATGTGLAPFVSILRDPHTWQTFDHLVLAHSVRQGKDLAYREEIAALCQEEAFAPFAHKLRFVPVVTREAVPGTLPRRLTQLVADGELERFVGLPLDAQAARILLCGNPAMLDELRDVLTDRGMRPDLERQPGNFALENYW